MTLWLLAVGMVAACSGGGDGDEPVAELASGTRTSTTAAAALEDTGPGHFRSQTGNIGCLIDADVARCDITERSWQPPPRPPACEFDWAVALEVRATAPGSPA